MKPLRCEICGEATLIPGEQIVDIKDTLSRWEKMGNLEFPREVLDYYLKDNPSPRLHQCTSCGFSIFLPVISGTQEFYDSVSENNYYVSEKWEHKEGRKDLAKIKPQIILDIGCGTGEFLNLTRRKMPDVELRGVDFSPSAVDTALERGFNVSLVTDLIESLKQFRDGQFNVITLFQVLEHLENPSQVIRAAKEKIEDGGFLIIAVPDEDGCVKHFPNSHTAVPPHHISRWKESVFRKGFQNLGFKVKRIKREPLPDYLWRSYLPAMWNEYFWLHLLLTLMPPLYPRDKYKKIEHFIRILKLFGVKNLYGLPGHTIYVLLQRVN